MLTKIKVKYQNNKTKKYGSGLLSDLIKNLVNQNLIC